MKQPCIEEVDLPRRIECNSILGILRQGNSVDIADQATRRVVYRPQFARLAGGVPHDEVLAVPDEGHIVDSAREGGNHLGSIAAPQLARLAGGVLHDEVLAIRAEGDIQGCAYKRDDHLAAGAVPQFAGLRAGRVPHDEILAIRAESHI